MKIFTTVFLFTAALNISAGEHIIHGAILQSAEKVECQSSYSNGPHEIFKVFFSCVDQACKSMNIVEENKSGEQEIVRTIEMDNLKDFESDLQFQFERANDQDRAMALNSATDFMERISDDIPVFVEESDTPHYIEVTAALVGTAIDVSKMGVQGVYYKMRAQRYRAKAKSMVESLVQVKKSEKVEMLKPLESYLLCSSLHNR